LQKSVPSRPRLNLSRQCLNNWFNPLRSTKCLSCPIALEGLPN
jgi:hypothetical protein